MIPVSPMVTVVAPGKPRASGDDPVVEPLPAPERV